MEKKLNFAVDQQEITLYNIDDIRRIFSMGRTAAYRLMTSDGFPAFRLNRKLYVTRDNLTRWIQNNRGKTYIY